jgi:GT2 family glycosyltransferase
MKKVGVVVPVLNQFEFAMKALESAKVPDSIHCEFFIINNWSENKGVSRAWNIGIKKAIKKKCDYILILNDDIVLAPDTIEYLCNAIDNNDIALISAGDYRHLMGPDAVMTASLSDDVDQMRHGPNFACFMITPDSYEKIGEFDEGFSPAYFEDNDYHHRGNLAGVRCVGSEVAMFYHYGSQTQNSGAQPIVPSGIFERNRHYYVNKWGGEPGTEAYTTPWNNSSLNWTATAQNTQ